MVVLPTPEEEDRRRICRERAILLRERIRYYTNRIKGLLAGQGITGFNPCTRTAGSYSTPLAPGTVDRFRTNSERKSCARSTHSIYLCARSPMLRPSVSFSSWLKASKTWSPIMLLQQLKGIGPEIVRLYLGGLFRSFGNRRQLAAYAGLAPTPRRSGTVDREQGISKAGNPQLRSTMIELAWLRQRHQPASTLSRWFHARVGKERGRIRRIAIVALARQAADCSLALSNRRRDPGGRRIEGRIASAIRKSHHRIDEASTSSDLGGWAAEAPGCKMPPSRLVPSSEPWPRRFGASCFERRPDVRFCGTSLQLTNRLKPRFRGSTTDEQANH